MVTELLSKQLGVVLKKRTFSLPNGGRIEIDAVSDTPPILCEIWAHQGAPKSAQKAKVMTDAMKLVYARTLITGGQTPELKFVFTDEEAATHFRHASTSWMAAALKVADVEVVVVPLPEDVRQAVIAAQRQQYR
ncbi:MAG: hypothetical protein C4558_07730 [Dehalococcoidia bacterium]|nr:MAG: hypothetical protein C4558_07730 [Dehalococcoidia bacterium]